MTMKKCLIFLLTAALVLCSTEQSLFATSKDETKTVKDVESLPNDPRVRSGKLANGLTYLLIKNKAESGTAHFGIAQKVGTVLEDKGQTGMFSMLETLMMRGTRNFPGNSVSLYFNSLGIPAENITFTTDKDNITYLVRNVPVKNDNTVDSTLLVLYNWMSSLNIDEEDIKAETPYLKSRLLNEWNAERRVDAKIMAELYPRSRYANAPDPSKVSNIGSYTSKDLRNFYYKWFRPDFQAVVVAGDIDPDILETKIKSLFATVPKPLEKQNRNYYTPKTYDGIKSVVAKDGEYNKTSLSINFLKKPLSSKYKNSSVAFIQEYMDNIISQLLYDRLREGIIAKNIPITNFSIKKDKFLNIHNSEAFTVEFETLPGTVYSAVSFVNSELVKLAKYGFNNQEASKYRDIYFRELENIYDNREMLPNDFYIKRLLNHFYDDGTLASVELKFEILKQIIFSISNNQLNGYAAAMLGQQDNIIITCKVPESSNINTPTNERLLAAFSDAGLSTPQRVPETSVLLWPVFNGGESRTAVVSSEVSDPVTGARIMILSNGATVIFKNNAVDSDTIAFRAVSKGGFSLMPNVTLAEEPYVNDILQLGGLGQISQPNIERLFLYNNMNLTAEIKDNREVLEGYCDSKGFEKLCHAIYMGMTERRADETAFNNYKQAKLYDISYRSLSPANIFKDTILQYSYNNKNYVHGITEEKVNNLDYATILDATRLRFSNAADFYFIFSGNLDIEQAKETVLKYIGAIPGNISKKENWIVVPNYLTKQNVSKRFLIKMINPHTFVNVTYSYGKPYTLKNLILTRITEQYLKNTAFGTQLRKLISNADISSTAKSYPEEIVAINVKFETDSAGASVAEESFNQALNRVACKRVETYEFEALKNNVRESFVTRSESNKFWLDIMEYRYIEGKDFYTNFQEVLQSLTLADFEKFIADIIERGNKISIVMDGTTKDVNTQNLFREDEFIKRYFGIE